MFNKSNPLNIWVTHVFSLLPVSRINFIYSHISNITNFLFIDKIRAHIQLFRQYRVALLVAFALSFQGYLCLVLLSLLTFGARRWVPPQHQFNSEHIQWELFDQIGEPEKDEKMFWRFCWLVLLIVSRRCWKSLVACGRVGEFLKGCFAGGSLIREHSWLSISD